jgi:integrase
MQLPTSASQTPYRRREAEAGSTSISVSAAPSNSVIVLNVAQLRLTDIEWQTGSLRVCGKSRYEVRLPLPQEVGDAIAAYLEGRPSACRSDLVFLRTIAPCRPFRRGDGISSVVKRLMKRAAIVTPVKGAHALRHTAATEMLRHGVPLDKIGLVLRHRGIDTTAYYAKADVGLQKQVAQPWPEAL